MFSPGFALLLVVVVIVCCVRAQRRKRGRVKGAFVLLTRPSGCRLKGQRSREPRSPSESAFVCRSDEEEFRLRSTRPEPPPHGHAPPGHRDHPCPHHHPAGHTGPRQQRRKQQRDPQRPRGSSQPNPRAPGQVGGPAPLLSSSTSTQGSRPAVNVSDGQPPPIPQPRKKTPRSM